jgi:hypothetical protein
MMFWYFLTFLFGMDLGLSVGMAASTVGKWQRRGGKPTWTNHKGRKREIGYLTAFVFLTIFLPLGMVHDQLRPGHAWITWSEPDE